MSVDMKKAVNLGELSWKVASSIGEVYYRRLQILKIVAD